MVERIDLVEAELRLLAGDLVDPDGAPFRSVVLATDDPHAELGRHVERTVFQEAFGNTPGLLADEYGPYEASSIFICVLDQRRQLPAGMMRVILPSDAGSKSLDDIERVWGRPLAQTLSDTGLTLPADGVWDLATLAVLPEYRRSGRGMVSLAVYQTLCTVALRCGIDWFVAVLDVAVLRLLQRQLRLPFSRYAGVEPLDYLGSAASVPAWCDFWPWSERLRLADPEYYETVCQGQGLEAAVAAPAWDDVVELVARVSPRGVPTRSL